MPTVLGGKGELSVVSLLVRCGCSQVTRSQHSSCAKDILQHMTQSWPSQQVLGGDPAQRMLYSSKEAKPPNTQQQRQGRGDAQLRMARHPRLAPHKSMLADDLKLSSDDDDSQKANRAPTSWDGHSLSVQRAHTHSRRVRHSSSGSSDSDCSAQSCSSSVSGGGGSGSSGSPRSHSPSRSPDIELDPESPAGSQHHDQETDCPSAAQWQLDKWLQKSKTNSASSEQDPSRRIPGRLPLPHNQRAPSPARSWDSNQEYSPSQSPIPSPEFHYSQSSTVPSPGYSYCPSPSPFPSTCASPSPRHCPVPSPDISICPSPHGSPRASRSPSPITRKPPKSPSPSLPAASRAPHYPGRAGGQAQPSPALNPHRPKSKSSSHPQPPHQSRTQPKHNQDGSESKSKASSDLHCKRAHHDKSRPKENGRPTSKQLSEANGGKQPAHQDHSGRPDHKLGPLSRSCSQRSPTRAKCLVSASRQTNPSLSSLFQFTSTAVPDSNTGLNSRSRTSSEHRAKPREAGAPTTARGNHTKTTQEKPKPRQRGAEQRGARPSRAEERRPARKEERHREKHQGKQERREDRRLAEEQLLRRSWVQSSSEEEEEEQEEEDGEVVERPRGREESDRGGHGGRREQKQRREWQTAPAKQLQCRQEEPHRAEARAEKRARSEEERSRQPPVTRPSSPSASSGSDSEPGYRAPVAQASADSTSRDRVSKKRPGESTGSADRRATSVQKPARPTEGTPAERKQKFYTLVPFGRGDGTTTTASQRGLRNLLVQIDLCLLRRVPDSGELSPVKKPPSSSSSLSSSAKDKQRDMKHPYVPDGAAKDGKRKRKLENGVSHKESKRGAPFANLPAGRKESECSVVTETTHNGLLEEYLDSKRPLSPVSPLSDDPEPAKPLAKAKTSALHLAHVQKNKDKNRDSAIKPKTEDECVKVLRPPQLPESWGPAGHRGALPNHETPHHAEYYLHEAKRMKHRADAMVDKLGKAVNYIDAALSFMECGKAMEEGPLEAKSPYAMYSETVELIRYAMRLKSHSGPGARQEDKQLAVLCFRCLALLYWQMFRLKKDHALKYSKVLLDYFKSSPKPSSTPPCWTNTGKGSGGTPSLSPNAKPVRQGSHANSHLPSVISIPHRIHQMAANHLTITNSVLYSYEYWEVADNLAKENKEFFNYLNTLSGPLTLHSGVAHAVQYTRQALQWIRISAKLN